jgi:hypothetical protein
VCALNLKRSPENVEFREWADPLSVGAGETEGVLVTSTNRPPGVSDGIEYTTAGNQPGERRARALGETRNAVPEYEHRCKKRCANGRVASDGDRYAATVSDEEG